MTERTSAPESVRDRIARSGILTRGLHKILPKIVEGDIAIKMSHERARQAEIERREMLGPIGRIKEDARQAVLAAFEPGFDERRKAEGRPEVPISGYSPDSYPSYNRTRERLLAELGLPNSSVIGRLEGAKVSFAMGVKNGQIMTEGNDPAVFLVGHDVRYTSLSGIMPLTVDTLAPMSTSELAALEQFAGSQVHVAYQEQFLDFMDRHI